MIELPKFVQGVTPVHLDMACSRCRRELCFNWDQPWGEWRVGETFWDGHERKHDLAGVWQPDVEECQS